MKILKVICLFLLALSGTIDCAQYARKTAAALGTAAYWGLTVSQPAGMLLDYKVKLDAEKTYGEYGENYNAVTFPKTMPFLKKELERVGLSNARVIPHYERSIAFVNDVCIERSLLVKSEESFARIEQVKMNQEEPSVEDLKTIHELQGILNHEANHLLHGDISWRFLAAAMGSALVPVSLRAIYRAFRPIVNQVKFPNARKVASGFVNAVVSGHIWNAASRVIEQQADDAVKDRAAIQGLADSLDNEKRRLDDLRTEHSYQAWIQENALTHPSPASRIEKLKSRLVEN